MKRISQQHTPTDQISRRRILQLGVGLGGTALFAGCAPAPTARPARPAATSVHIGAGAVVDTMDPHAVLGVADYQAIRPVYDALVSFDERGERIIPQLAHSWQRIDAKTMEFKLRDDVKFSNGEDFTAETVAFTIERVMTSTNPLHSDRKQRLGTLAAGEVVNSTTVRVKTTEPDPLLLNRMTYLFMVSAQ